MITISARWRPVYGIPVTFPHNYSYRELWGKLGYFGGGVQIPAPTIVQPSALIPSTCLSIRQTTNSIELTLSLNYPIYGCSDNSVEEDHTTFNLSYLGLLVHCRIQACTVTIGVHASISWSDQIPNLRTQTRVCLLSIVHGSVLLPPLRSSFKCSQNKSRPLCPAGLPNPYDLNVLRYCIVVESVRLLDQWVVG